MAGELWWSELDVVIAAAVPAGSRILDVGCGDGGLVDRLAELGFDALGVDPHAPTHRRLVSERVEHATGLGEFDAITAVMALHHANLDTVVPALDHLLRPHGSLFVYELVWDTYDERSASWLAAHDPSVVDNSIAGWRREHADLHTSTTIKDALSAWFRPTLEARRPYLARMLARPDPLCQDHVRQLEAQWFTAEGVIGDPGARVIGGASWFGVSWRRTARRVVAVVGSAVGRRSVAASLASVVQRGVQAGDRRGV